jgi:DNA-binding transcriptional LysR family regulator
MDRLREMALFVAVADAGSFTQAAVLEGVSPPSVTRAIASLEDRLGTQLFTRTTRKLSLTEPGALFLESSRRLLADITSAEKEAAGETTTPQGHLRVTGSVTFGRVLLSSVLSAFLDNHTKVTASLMLFDRVVDLVEEGIDVGVRIGELPSSSLMARRVGEVRRVLVASPDYLDRSPGAHTPDDLQNHTLIGFTGLAQGGEWRFADGTRPLRPLAISPRLEVNDASAALTMAEAGDGITIALSYMVATDISAGTLVPVLDAHMPAPVPVHLVYPQSRLVAPKVRAFVDFAAPRLQQTLTALEIPRQGGAG